MTHHSMQHSIKLSLVVRKLLAALFAAAMVFALLPTAALAEDPEKYPVRIDGSRFNSEALTKTCGNGTATLDVNTSPYTLTLNNATITPTNSTYMYGILVETGLRIVLEGTNVINSGTAGTGNAYGINVTDGHDLTISGSGSLTVYSGIPTGSTTNSYGIRVGNALTIDASGGTVTAMGANGSELTNNWGIYANNGMTVKNGTVIAEGGLAASSIGIRVKGGMSITGGSVTAKGGSNTGSTTNSYGIQASGAVTVSGGSLTAHGYAAEKSNYGMHASASELTVENGATVTATCAKAATGSSYAIYTNHLTLKSGEVNATGGEAAENSIGVRANTSIDVSGGVLTAKGVSGKNPKANYGIYTDGDMTVSNGTVTAQGGAATSSSLGISTSGSFGMTNGTVTASSGNATADVSYAIMAKTGFTVENGTITATGGEAAQVSVGVYCLDDMGISGGELTASGATNGSQESNYGIYTDKSITISGGTVEAHGHAATTNSHGIAAYNNLTITGGETTAAGNSRALSKQPVFGTANPNWYQWRKNTSAVVPTGAFTRSRVTAYTRTSNDKYLNIAPDSSAAAIGNVTVSGTAGAAITPADITITLTEDQFGGLAAGVDVSGWFTNLPAGLVAKLKAEVTAGAGAATVTVSGTPTHASAAPIAITLPASALQSGAALPATNNESAKWGIVANAGVSPASAGFDRYTDSTGYEHKTFTLTPGSYTLRAIKISADTLIINTDYTVSGNDYTIKKEKLATLATGEHTITFEMNGGTNPEVTLTVTDSSPTSYTIAYNSNGGGGTMANSVVAIGDALTLPDCGFTPPANGVFKEWAIGSPDSTNRLAPGASYTFTSSTTLYAVWTAPTGDLGGLVTDGENNPVKGVTVRVFHGSNELKRTTTDANGAFSFTGLYYGVYSLVGTKDTRTVTDIISVKQESTNGDLILPAANKNTVVETAAGAPPVAATGLNEQYTNTADSEDKGITSEDNEVIEAGGSVELKLSAAAKVIGSDPDAEKINEKLDSGESLALLVDLSVTKTVTPNVGEASETKLTELPALIEIYVELPASLRGSTNLKVLRVHGGEVQELPYDGESFSFTDDGVYLILHVRRFSSYAIAVGSDAPPVVPDTPGGDDPAPTGPHITAHPQSAIVTEDGRATFTIAASGTGTLRFQWQINRGSVWEDIPGTNAASYTTSETSLTNNGYLYRCIVWDNNGSAMSNAATLTVIEYLDIPKTGDNSLPGLWIGLMLIAGAGLAASIVLGRRKRRA